MSQVKLQGIIPAIVTPMNERYEIVEEDFRNYIRWLMSFNIGGLAVNADTGEGLSLTVEERRMTIATASTVVKERAPIVAGLPPSTTGVAVQAALESKEAGADALLVYPHPYFYGHPLPSELPYRYHRAIADGSHMPIVLFQLQTALGGYEFGQEALLRLVEIPEVVAIKEASFDAHKYSSTLRILREAPRKIAILTGNDNFIAESLVMGADGALIGFGTLATERQVEMYELVKKRRYGEAMEIWETLLPLIDAIFAPPVRDYRARTKAALALQGIIENTHVRPPLLPISQEETSKIREALIKTGIPAERRVVAKATM